jgi:hypothetical protein
VTYGDPALLGETLTLTPAATRGSLLWDCRSSLPASVLPPSCR